jgi:uncharacterized FAD-dependent dehydrogenase
MKKELNIAVSPPDANEPSRLKTIVSENLKTDITRIKGLVIRRRSIDARNPNIRINLGLDIFIDEEMPFAEKPTFSYPDVSKKPPVVIVGAGPAGLFAALHLIELGFKPVIFERGKTVSERKRDIAAIHREQIIDPDSNYGFGEGGAGTFSDGKLYTRSKKKGDVRKILEVLSFHGAQDEILIEAHPHIGTNILPRVIVAIRNSILNAGGEFHFNSRITDLVIRDHEAKGVVLSDGSAFEGVAVVLATGHSSRDIYRMIHEKGILLEAKPFAVGVRVEHPQELIDQIQYHGTKRGAYLPAATYSFVEQVHDRGVYSFCMCPGGVIVPAATAPGELVVNGMSTSDRGGRFANSGMVVEIRLGDLPVRDKIPEMFAGLLFQEELEKLCFKMAGNTQFAPAQRLADFVSGRRSVNLPESSYLPGLIESPLYEWLPGLVGSGLQEGFKLIGRKTKGFLTNEAIILGVESRTSSPVRIPRDMQTLEHVQIKRLFPCGEGSGYAGGIMSSAVDGERVAEMIAKLYK